MPTDLVDLLQEVEQQEASEPGQFEDFLNRPIPENKVDETTEEVPFGMTALQLKSAGWSLVYHRKDRDPRPVNNNMRRQVLETKDAEGNLVFQANKPTQAPFRGKLRCRLHSKDDQRADWDEMGLSTCGKSNMNNLFDVRQHMLHKHKIEWATIEERRLRIEREEDRAMQQRILTLATENAGVVTPVATSEAIPSSFVVNCDDCEHIEEAGIKIGPSIR